MVRFSAFTEEPSTGNYAKMPICTKSVRKSGQCWRMFAAETSLVGSKCCDVGLLNNRFSLV